MEDKHKRLTQARLKELLHYNPKTGYFTRLTAPSNSVKVGDIAGCLDKTDGYIRISIDDRKYRAHRLAFLYMTGEWPTDQTDHDNHIRSDNKWDNLNQATHATNNKNQSIRSDNTSGFVGVFWNKQDSKWVAQIRVNGKKKHLGVFTDKSNAITARRTANIKYGFHQHHGKSSFISKEIL